MCVNDYWVRPVGHHVPVGTLSDTIGQREGRKEGRGGKYIYIYNLGQTGTHNAALTHIHNNTNLCVIQQRAARNPDCGVTPESNE